MIKLTVGWYSCTYSRVFTVYRIVVYIRYRTILESSVLYIRIHRYSSLLMVPSFHYEMGRSPLLYYTI